MGLENYSIVRKIGEGGSGLTYLVRDSSGDERCMKEFRFGMKKGDEETFKARELFEREAQTLATLNHPQIPRYLDFFVGGDNGEERLYLVMEHVPGKTLDELLKVQRFNEDGALNISKKVVNVLEYLHSFSPPIIHRDIKPKNIIQTPDGIIKLLDFGSVVDKVLQETKFSFTRVGSFGFMAPELMYGKPTKASDIYSLGATLVSLLSGGADPVNLMNSNHRLDFKGKLNVSKRTENLLLDMTEPDLGKRIQNTEELRQRIYGNGVSVSQSFKTSDEVEIHYDNIEINNKRWFWARWDLKMILDRFNDLFSRVKFIANDYGRELIVSPITIKVKYGGKEIELHSPEETFKILPTKEQQKTGLKEVLTTFATSDDKIKGTLNYAYLGAKSYGYGTIATPLVRASLEFKGTDKNREEYNRLYNALHGKK